MLGLTGTLGIKSFAETLLRGRARDLDGDGKIDAGGDTFSSYAFHSRDTVRQSVLDHLQFIRVLRGFDGKRQFKGSGISSAAGSGTLLGAGFGTLLAGDFNGDGVVDVGGPSLPYFVWGSSMGGIHAGIIGAVEPAVVAAAPVAGGGALTHLSGRSVQETVRRDTVMRVLGPVIVGAPAKSGAAGAVEVSYIHPLARKLRVLPVGSFTGVRVGWMVVVKNLTSGRTVRARVSQGGRFNLHLRADAGDRFTVTLYDGAGEEEKAELNTWPADVWFKQGGSPTYRKGAALRSPAEGWGYHRGSPELRRLMGLAQMVLDPADPINYAPHFFQDPLAVRPEGKRVTNLLTIVTLGDPMNPMDIHGSVGRAAGLIAYRNPDPTIGDTPNGYLIKNWVYEGICGLGRHPLTSTGSEALFDPDRLDDLKTTGDEDGNGFHAPSPPRGQELRLSVSTSTGVSGVRFGHIKPCGKHSFFITDPSNKFNVDAYLNNLAAHYFATNGKVILDDKCLETGSCPLP